METRRRIEELFQIIEIENKTGNKTLEEFQLKACKELKEILKNPNLDGDFLIMMCLEFRKLGRMNFQNHCKNFA